MCFQGARRKIAASVTRLRERPRILAEIDREVDEGRADLKRLLSELEAKQVLFYLLIGVKFTLRIIFFRAGSAEVSDYLGGAGICSLSLRPPTFFAVAVDIHSLQKVLLRC